jgi:CspA family cold shock protein
METGTVKWFNRIKGFGFISSDKGGPELFAHYSQIHGDGYRNLREGQRVEFNTVVTDKGPCAHNIVSI